jgi:hypothetical protein
MAYAIAVATSLFPVGYRQSRACCLQDRIFGVPFDPLAYSCTSDWWAKLGLFESHQAPSHTALLEGEKKRKDKEKEKQIDNFLGRSMSCCLYVKSQSAMAPIQAAFMDNLTIYDCYLRHVPIADIKMEKP